MMKITLYYVYDPMCSWCYGLKKTFDEVKNELSSDIDIVYVAGGLAPHNNEPMAIEMQEKLESIWQQITLYTGTKFNHEYWRVNKPRRSTYLSCQAVIAARLQNKEEEMISAVQEAYYLKAKNPSNEDTLVTCAKEIDLDCEKFKKDLYSQEVLSLFQADLKLKSTLRVQGFPSLVLKYKKEAYPINIDYNNKDNILKQINNLSQNRYF